MYAAMRVVGIETPGELSTRCNGVITRHTARNWLSMKDATVDAVTLSLVARCIGVRLGFLTDGEPPMQRPSEDLKRARIILSRLEPAPAQRWLKEGERLMR